VSFVPALNYLIDYHLIFSKVQNETPRFSVVWRKYLITHVIYSVDKFLSSSNAAVPSQHHY